MATAPSRSPVTYGELFTKATTLLDTAVHADIGPFSTKQQACDTLIGYQRLLATIGHHLTLLAAPGQQGRRAGAGRAPALPELLSRFPSRATPPELETTWERATETLGVADDLLASQLSPTGVPRSPQAGVLLDSRATSAAANRLMVGALPSLAVCRMLLARAQVTHGPPGSLKAAAAVRSQLQQQAPRLRRLIADVTSDQPPPDPGLLARLDALSPISLPLPDRTGSFESALGALRALQLISHRQATTGLAANNASLTALTDVAIAVARRTAARLPYPTDPLGKIRRAVAVDTLTAAASAWRDAATAIASARGTDKAPRVSAAATAALAADTTNPAVDLAVLAALPRLGRDAAVTTERLARTGRLYVPVRRVVHAAPTWVPPSPSHTDRLASAFRAAAAATAAAHHAASLVHTTTAQSPRPTSTRVTAVATPPVVGRSSEPTQPGVTR